MSGLGIRSHSWEVKVSDGAPLPVEEGELSGLSSAEAVHACNDSVGHWELVPGVPCDHNPGTEIEKTEPALEGAGVAQAYPALGAGKLAVARFVVLVDLAVLTKFKGKVGLVAQDFSCQEGSRTVAIV